MFSFRALYWVLHYAQDSTSETYAPFWIQSSDIKTVKLKRYVYVRMLVEFVDVIVYQLEKKFYDYFI